MSKIKAIAVLVGLSELLPKLKAPSYSMEKQIILLTSRSNICSNAPSKATVRAHMT